MGRTTVFTESYATKPVIVPYEIGEITENTNIRWTNAPDGVGRK